MRHRMKTVKLGRSQAHRDALLANLTVSLINHERIKTTLAKAKAVRPYAEKLLTLGKKNTLHSRRTALAYLRHNEEAVSKLFGEIAPRAASRNGGYTRIIKLGLRKSDAAPMAFIEWVDKPEGEEAAVEEPKAKETKAAKSKAPKESGEAKEPKKPRKSKKASEGEDAPAAE